MISISIAGAIVLLQAIRTFFVQNSRQNRSIIIGFGLIALIISLLVFPYEVFQLIQVLQVANKHATFVAGAISLEFVPLFYGFCWFLISIGCWVFLRKYQPSGI